MNAKRIEAASPLFIIGSPRSGTSVLVDAAFTAGYGGFRESNLLPLLVPIRDQVATHFKRFGTDNPRVLTAHLQPETLYRSIAELFKQTVEALNPQPPWVDKTCNSPMILVLEDLVSLWPECRIVFAKRRAIENVRSRLKKFPARDFSYHSQDWALIMSSWRTVREKLEPWRYREIDQFDMIGAPQAVAAELGGLLSLDSGAQARIVHVLKTLRPQQTAAGTAEQILSLETAGWTKAQMKEFQETCGAEMQAYGYTLDETYRKPTSRAAGDSSSAA
jgi:hypothetical protein